MGWFTCSTCSSMFNRAGEKKFGMAGYDEVYVDRVCGDEWYDASHIFTIIY